MTIRIGPFSFQPGVVTTLAAVAFIALTLSLSRWQVNRGHEKAGRQALLEARMADAPVRLTGAVSSPDDLMYRHVRAGGQWLAERQIFIDNQIHEGRAGFNVITPLRLDGVSDAVLVNRGWIARGSTYPTPPEVAVPGGHIEVSGLATRPPARYLELSAETVTGNVWQNLSIERYRSRTGLAVLPVVVLADAATAGLVPLRERPDAGIAKHQEYALTWLALAVTAFVLWVALNLHRTR